MTIAIVDDIKEERVLLRTRLEKIFHQKDMGFHCCEYENGEAFLEASKDQDITVLFWTFIWMVQMGLKLQRNSGNRIKTVC